VSEEEVKMPVAGGRIFIACSHARFQADYILEGIKRMGEPNWLDVLKVLFGICR
jgi:hypothetical protein